jgi:uncharacterized protein (DUF2141 family)
MNAIARALALGLLLSAAVPVGAQTGAPVIVVEVANLRSDRGEVRGALFHSPRGWTEAGRQIATCRARIVDHRARCALEGVAPGTYAFAFLHDENGNGTLDRDLVGWPQEGFGFSNDAPTGLGPPSFDSASFEHGGEATVVAVRARYGI